MTNTPTPALPSNVEELLPCPFCGWKAEGPQKFASAEWEGARSIVCSNPDCKQFFYHSNRFETREQTDANLIARWNRRTSTPTEKEAGEISELSPDDAEFGMSDHRARSASVTAALQKRPVAFRVRDNEEEGCEWAIFLEEENAAKHAERHGVEYQGLYVRDGTPTPPAHAEYIATAFYEHIKHGDEKHREWLKSECDGKLIQLLKESPLPPAHGEGELRALIEKQLAIIEDELGNADGKDVVTWESGRETCCDDGTLDLSDAYKALEEIRRALSHAPSPPQQDGGGLVEVITDEMVERACNAYSGYIHAATGKLVYGSKNGMKLALEAALASTPKASGEKP